MSRKTKKSTYIEFFRWIKQYALEHKGKMPTLREPLFYGFYKTTSAVASAYAKMCDFGWLEKHEQDNPDHTKTVYYTIRDSSFTLTEPSRILDETSEDWEEFIERLIGEEGCNFREENGKYVWDCKGNLDYARAILESMYEYNIEATLSYFESCGGHCDCEIVFNLWKGG